MAKHLRPIRASCYVCIALLAVVLATAHREAPAQTYGGLSPGMFAPSGGASTLPDSKSPGLLPPRTATNNHDWLTQPAISSTPNYEQPQPAGVVTPEPFTPTAGDVINLDELAAPAPPEIRVAGLTEQTVAPLNQMSPEPQGQLPPGARDGVFQKIYLNGSWLPVIEDEPDALGFAEFDTGVVLGFPFTRRDTPLLVTPQFGMHFLENADALDIPSTLYDAAVEFRHLRKLGGGPWAMDAAATVGYYSDFDQGSSEALRITGRGIAVYETSPQAKWLLGVAYLNRAGASVLPIFGAILEPTPNTKFEAIFPRPRFMWRTASSQPGVDEGWIFFGGEFGGGVWSVTRPSTGDLDLINYSDWRLLAGYERKITGGLSTRYETGYVFNRELEYDSATPDASLDDTIFVRAGVMY
ncbi:MAG TPA: DUF6268 family outer membrane beta-barrel protein [Lacipirellula sp.]